MLDIKKVVVSCLSTVILYLPWLGIVIKTVMRSKDNFWLTAIPTFRESIDYLFSYKLGFGVWGGVLLVGLLLAFAYETKILQLNINERHELNVFFSVRKFCCSKNVFWIISGLSSILGTIIVGIVVSDVIRPFYLLRYIYPVSVVAWMILGVIISRLKGSKIYAFVLICYMIVAFVPSYKMKYVNEKNSNVTLQNTLNVLQDKIAMGDIILTDVIHIDWSIAEYYFPGVETELIDDETFSELQQSKEYVLIVNGDEDISIISEQLNEEGFVCDLLYENGVLGTMPVDIYSIAH